MNAIKYRGLVALVAASLLVSAVPARTAALRGAPAAAAVAARTPGANSASGVVGAIGCGLGARFFPVLVLGGVGWIGAWVGACALMITDALSTPD